MSSEIRVTGEIRYSKNGVVWDQPLTLTRDCAGDESAAPYVQIIGTSDETIVPPDIAAGGLFYIQNLDSTNYVQLGGAAATYMLRLLAGDKFFFRLDNSATLYAKANTAACRVLVAAADL